MPVSETTKCLDGCREKLYCKRYTSPVIAPKQSFYDFRPDPETGVCAYFLGNLVWYSDKDRPELVNHNED